MSGRKCDICGRKISISSSDISESNIRKTIVVDLGKVIKTKPLYIKQGWG